MCVCAQSLSHVWLFATLWTVALQAPLSMGILQARTLEWVAIFSSRGSTWTQGSNLSLLCLMHCRQILYLLNHRWRVNFSQGSAMWLALFHGILIDIMQAGTLKHLHGWVCPLLPLPTPWERLVQKEDEKNMNQIYPAWTSWTQQTADAWVNVAKISRTIQSYPCLTQPPTASL